MILIGVPVAADAVDAVLPAALLDELDELDDLLELLHAAATTAIRTTATMPRRLEPMNPPYGRIS